MESYVCEICGVEKPITDFYKEVSKRGHTKNCIECIKKRKKEYYKNNPEKLKETIKRDNAGRVLRQRGYSKRNKEKVLKMNTEQYYKNREKRIEYAREHRKKFPKQEHAHQVLRSAIRSGQIIRPDECEICHKKCKPQAHHEDYSKPLDVIWLCRSCHSLVHRDYFNEYARLLNDIKKESEDE